MSADAKHITTERAEQNKDGKLACRDGLTKGVPVGEIERRVRAEPFNLFAALPRLVVGWEQRGEAARKKSKGFKPASWTPGCRASATYRAF